MNPVCSRGRWALRCATFTALGLILFVCGIPLFAQASGQQASWEVEVQQLQQQVQTLQARISQLESEHKVQSGAAPAPKSDSAVGEQTFRGRLTCANMSAASYTCGHSKNESIWGCSLHCAKGPDGSQYALQTTDKTYSVTGDPKRLGHFAADDVVVSGELSGDAIKISSIAKPSRKSNQEKAVLESSAR